MTTRESKILLRYQLKDEVSRELKTVEGNIKQHSRQVGLALTAIGAIGIVIGKQVIDSAIEQRNAERVLAAAVEATGASWDAQRESVLAATAALQIKTGVADEAQLRALVTLTNALGDSGQALEALELALDASAGSGRDLQAVVDTLGRALAGQVNTSISLNTVFDKTQDFQSRLAQGFEIVRGQAEANLNPLTLLGVIVGDLGEKFGGALLPALIPITKQLALAAVFIGDLIESNQTLFNILVPVIGAVVLFAAVLGPILLILPGIAIAMGVVSLAMFGWVIAIAAVVAAVVALTIIIVRNWDTIKNAVIGTINLIIQAINALVEALFQLSGFGILNRVSGLLGGPSISGVPNIPQISTAVPEMDTGGIVQGPGLFSVGPGVREIVRGPGGGDTIVVNVTSPLIPDTVTIRNLAAQIERAVSRQRRGRTRTV